MVKLLLDKGVDVDSQDAYGTTPLMAAQHIEMVKFLLHNNAKLDIQDGEGNSALLRNFYYPNYNYNIMILILSS